MYYGKNSMAVSCCRIRAVLFIRVHCTAGVDKYFYSGVKGYSFMGPQAGQPKENDSAFNKIAKKHSK
jgi:hypothetical protein